MAAGSLQPTPALLQLEGLSVSYGGISALREVSFEVGRGELVALLGANGAGKSTTLKAISRLEPAAAGRPEGRRVLARQSVAANLELGAWLRRDRAAITADLERCYGLFPRLAERRQQLAGSLSGGEQQMLAIARALMGRPTLLLLDEPSLGLAPKLVAELMATLAALHRDGLSMLLVEQNATAALAIADRAVVLETGRVRLQGSAAELRHDPELQALYLGGGG